MSVITKIEGDLKKIPLVLEDYENEIPKAKELLDTEGKLLETLNRENPSWFYYFAERKSELKHLLEFVDRDVNRVHSKLYRKFNENHSLALTPTAIDRYIKSETEYDIRKQIYNEVKEIYDKFESITKAFEQLGFALRNVTELRVNSLQETDL